MSTQGLLARKVLVTLYLSLHYLKKMLSDKVFLIRPLMLVIINQSINVVKAMKYKQIEYIEIIVKCVWCIKYQICVFVIWYKVR